MSILTGRDYALHSALIILSERGETTVPESFAVAQQFNDFGGVEDTVREALKSWNRLGYLDRENRPRGQPDIYRATHALEGVDPVFDPAVLDVLDGGQDE